ncbi:MAG TPA: hypothetical protein VI299_22585 [Polyangiales bacterium]
MRTHLYALALCGVFACSDESSPRPTYELGQNPSTMLDASDTPTPPRRPDGGRSNLVGDQGSSRVDPQPPADAGRVPDASAVSDASVGDGGSPYACQTGNDCTVRDVGSCCGYYPRCANVNAVFVRPVCNGTAGVCGFPVIDSCACVQGTCVSLQAGTPVSP